MQQCCQRWRCWLEVESSTRATCSSTFASVEDKTSVFILNWLKVQDIDQKVRQDTWFLNFSS